MSLWKNIYEISPSSIQKWSLQNERTQAHFLGKTLPVIKWWFMPGTCPPILCWKFQGGYCNYIIIILHLRLVGGWTTHLKNMRKSNWIIMKPQIGMNIKNHWNHLPNGVFWIFLFIFWGPQKAPEKTLAPPSSPRIIQTWIFKLLVRVPLSPAQLGTSVPGAENSCE